MSDTGTDAGKETEAVRRPRRRRGNSFLTVLGVGLLVLGLGCLGYVGWQFFGTNVVSEREQTSQVEQLKERWREPAAKPEGQRIPGDAIGLLRIPALGKDYQVPILTGTDLATLGKGVGWYEGSAEPGQDGNFAVAGHRVTHGEPFRRLLELERGDQVVIETRDAIYTYELISAPAELTVQDTDTWVLDADPVQRSDTPDGAYLTLTTCQDLFRSPDRSVAFGKLVKTVNK